MALNPKQQRFVEEYLVDLNATKAAIRAGYSPRGAATAGERMLRNVEIDSAVKAAQAALGERTGITAETVLRQWWDIASASANDLVQLRRLSCRYCHGEGHDYQWTEREHREACAKAQGRDKPAPDALGGYGFDPYRDPHPDCPECRGEGIAQAHALDSRKLSGKARLLYAGVKQTKEGLEIKMRDQDGALDRVARHLGMFVERHQHTGKDGGAIVTETRLDLSALDQHDRDHLRAILSRRPGEA